MDAAAHIRKLAQLAALDLTEEEVERFAADLPAVMEHMARVQGDGSGEAPLLPPTEGQPDEPAESLAAAVVLGLAPRTDGGHVIAHLPRGR